jgi:hypothetical protein
MEMWRAEETDKGKTENCSARLSSVSEILGAISSWKSKCERNVLNRLFLWRWHVKCLDCRGLKHGDEEGRPIKATSRPLG